ncbi:MAG: glycosyltransferase family 39 protein [Spirulina sp. SIO3F2]|nr:glycosyltransferase family 39 protein [Spirulina sp. SIO3F2]
MTELEQDWQQGILTGVIVWGSAVVLIAEGLGSIRQFALLPVACAWLIFDMALFLAWRRWVGHWPRLRQLTRLTEFKGSLHLLLIITVVMVGLVGITAFVAPTNNWDSMTYHMARVMHWLQNQTLAHYPTYYSPQLYHPPWAELTIAHFQMLSGGDRWANGVQWLSCIGSGIGVAAITRQLGATARGQLLAAAFAVTLPIGLLQAATTQNDYVVCFWLVCFVAKGLQVIKAEQIDWALNLKAAVAVAIAFLTKTSAYLLAFPFLLWLFITLLHKAKWRIWQPTLTLTTSIVLINGGHFWRNWQLFGAPISDGPPEFADVYSVETHSLAALLSNLVRNLGFHLSTPSLWLNAQLNGLITRFHHLLGIEPNDPRITAPGSTLGIFPISFNEDLAGNSIHFVVLSLALLSFILSAQFRRQWLVRNYLLCGVGAYIVFCGLLKWQVYHSRHHLSLFVLMAPIVGWVLAQLRWQQWINGLMVAIAIASLPWVVNAEFRPWFGSQTMFITPRTAQYFVQRPWLQDPYQNASAFLQKQSCQNIALSFGYEKSQVWEYPFWVLLNNQNGQNKTLRHLANGGITDVLQSQAPHTNYQPCAVIEFQVEDKATPFQKVKPLEINGQSYSIVWEQEPLTIFLPVDDRL